MQFPQYQQTFLERIIARVLPEIAQHLDPVCKKTFWNCQPWKGAERTVETRSGSRQVAGIIQGRGRVLDLFHHADASIEVTFGHGKFASRLSEGTIVHDWLPAGKDHAPIISAPSQRLIRDFSESCFAIRLYSTVQPGGVVATPQLNPRDLVAYQILALDDDGREGVAVKIERA